MGLSNHRAAKVPMFTVKHKKARLAFAKKMMDYDWDKVNIIIFGVL